MLLPLRVPLLLLFLAAVARAQSVRRLELASPPTPDLLALRWVEQRGDERRELSLPGGAGAGWIFVREEGRAENLDLFPVGPEDRTLLLLARHDARPAVVGMDAIPRLESLAAAELATFLVERAGLAPERVAALRREPERMVTVRRFDSLAALVPGARPGPPSAVVTAKRGQRLELRTLMDPFALRTPTDLPFRLYSPPEALRLEPAVHFGRLEGGERARLRITPDRAGSATIAGPGTWLLEAHLVEAPATEDDDTWTITSSTLLIPLSEGAPADGERK